jgi:hypothetical protein
MRRPVRTPEGREPTMIDTTRTARLLALAAAVTLTAGTACGSDDSSGLDDTTTTGSADAAETVATSAAAPTTETPGTDPPPSAPPTAVAPEADTTTTESADTGDRSGELPPTDAVAALDNAYTFRGGTPDPASLPASVDEVEAHWYRSGDALAVVYVGLDPEVDACPGNSANTVDGFVFVSNASLPNASCPDFPTLIDSDENQGVQLCDGRVGYRTLIPADTVGQLFASVERPDPDPTVQGVGITGFVEVLDPASLPELTAEQLAC